MELAKKVATKPKHVQIPLDGKSQTENQYPHCPNGETLKPNATITCPFAEIMTYLTVLQASGNLDSEGWTTLILGHLTRLTKDCINKPDLIRLTEDCIHQPGQPATHSLHALNTVFRKLNAQSESKIPYIFDITEAKPAKLKAFFRIDNDGIRIANEPWRLGNNALMVPRRLRDDLKELMETFDESVEAKCRFAVDTMLFECYHTLLKNLGARSNDKSKPPRGSSNRCEILETGSNITLLPGVNMSMTTINPYTRQPVMMQGRADWLFSYIPRHHVENSVVVMQAKKPSQLSMAGFRLLTYLIMVHENRCKMGETDTSAQGFSTDGTEYVFMCIGSDGIVRRSDQYNILREAEFTTVFNFIVSMFEKGQ